MSLGEGGTPLVAAPGVAEILGLKRLWLKREDLNPTGSHKARGAAFQVAAVRSEGARVLLISSSGNAAVAAAAYAAAAGLHVVAFVAPGTPRSKLGPLSRHGARIVVSPRALGLAAEVAKATGFPNLRPSTHPWAVPGYMTLGWELAAEAPEAQAVFLFVGSGATLVGLHRSRDSIPGPGVARWGAALHAVQGTGASPVVDELVPAPAHIDRAGATLGALGARKTRRLGEAVRAVRSSGGTGWRVSDDDAEAAAALLAQHGLETSLEGGASVAAAAQAARDGGPSRVVAVLTGHAATTPGYASVPDSALLEAPDLDAAIALVLAPW